MTRAPAPASVDLRVQPIDGVLDRVERSLGVQVDRGGLVRKRRSIGARTDRGTWVRIERRLMERIGGQSWNGTEAAAVLTAVAMPEWIGGVAWRGEEPGATVMWRADETEWVPDAPVKPAGTLLADPHLSEAWWSVFNASMDALARQETTRLATPDTVPATQTHVSAVIEAAFPGVVDTTIDQWSCAHADLNWANLTAPACWFLDWEDWGRAPRGLDAATVWGSSLAVPALADRVRLERRADLASRTGKLMSLFYCAKIAGPGAAADDPLVEPARREADRLIRELQRASGRAE